MRQVEEEYWKFTDTSGVGNATNQRLPFITPTPNAQITTFRGPQREAIERWVGDVKSNLALSTDRAFSVRNLLLAQGIDEKRLVDFKGFGASKPIADNATEAGRAKNRRTEFVIVGK